MFKRTKVSTGALLALGVIAALPTQAQEAAQRVEVTGSNIRRTDIETASPLQVITANELKASGYTTVAEVLRDLTANGQGTMSSSFGRAFAAGANGVSLRGLTVGATLVLIDGYRMAPYPLSDDGQRPFVDTSAIPFSAVERIEILKDGASAVYGSDAIAGVVNVILKKNYAGTGISAEYGTTQHGGGATKNASLIHGFGSASDKLSGYVALEFRKQDEIRLEQRSGDWTNMDFRSTGGNDLRPGARNLFAATPRLATPYLQIPNSASGNAANFAFYPGCTHVDMRASNCTYINNWAQIQPSTENINLVGRLNARLGPDWDINVNAGFFDSKSQQIVSPGNIPYGTFAGITAIGPNQTPSIVGAVDDYTVPADYPGNTLGVAAGIRGLLNGVQPRVTDVESKSIRLVAEINGQAMGWDLRGALGHTRVETVQKFSGYIHAANLLTALNRSTDRFLVSGGNSQAVMDFVSPTVTNKTTDELDFIGLRGSRDLLTLPGGPLGLAVGLDYRYKNLNAPDPLEAQNGSVIGITGAYAVGSEHVTSLYAELAAPVSKTLELSAALRADRYDTYGRSTTPKVGFKFSPMRELSLRGTYAHGFRAPSATENGSAGSLFAFNSIRDPLLCPTSLTDGSPDLNAPTNVPAQCDLNPTYLQGTTKDIQPEKSKSFTLGIVAEPVRNWSMALDYYRIQLRNQIIPAAALASFDPLLYVVRTTPQQVTFGDDSTGLSSVGPIQYVNTPYVNGQTTETSGIEFDTRYKFSVPDVGVVNVGFQFTHMFNYDLSVNGKTYKLAGTHGPSIISGNTGNPKNKMQFTLGVESGPLAVSTTTSYTGSYDVTDPSKGLVTCEAALHDGNSYWSGAVPEQYCRVKSFVTTNVSVRYKVGKALTLRGAVVNLFDKAPPVDAQTYGGGSALNASSNGSGIPYNPSLHQAGAIGRMFSLGLDYKF